MGILKNILRKKMKVDEFKTKWTSVEDNLNPISLSRLDKLGLSKISIQFLTKSGLPNAAAPQLSFKKDSDGNYDGIKKLTVVLPHLDNEFEKYIVIGSADDGDPIVINNKEKDKIESLDHENNFSSTTINSNINVFSNCLLIYRDYILKLIEEKGDDAYFNLDFTDEEFEKLKTDLIKVDSEILKPNNFWAKQLEMDWELRKQYKNEK